ncbi:poly-gamma-glutamate hydrolase family protein [Pseudomonas koreensis]|uniref:poly-gamma-glutamate hydrolase family protein n=1 Tax=Pseudomonas koreensis TaxID=198620 RepID=UPI0021C60E44|nr:poly-gamma-glutamate hydrolase family protein [Pseudomonas koreensis]MCU0070226.1 poly-gamma-glutamate hydrolase family protein [Pseudomonas koreensis]
MSDKYVNFAALSGSESDEAYRIVVRQRNSAIALIAPHAGKIEFGTSEICLSVAGEDLTYYLFEGCKPDNNTDLHITSSRFDEPKGLDIAQSAQMVVTFHGQKGSDHFVNVGGLEEQLCVSLICHLRAGGFVADWNKNPNLQGREKNNICNRGIKEKGLQLEISRGLREALTTDKKAMECFSRAVRSALDKA